eukprot:scaffold83860_cov60-Phaeocystis_antarctica.AAC.1
MRGSAFFGGKSVSPSLSSPRSQPRRANGSLNIWRQPALVVYSHPLSPEVERVVGESMVTRRLVCNLPRARRQRRLVVNWTAGRRAVRSGWCQ